MAVVTAALLIMPSIILAAWWDASAIPLPSGAEKEMEQKRKIMGSEFDFLYCSTLQDMESVKKFYQLQLTQAGWQERKLADDLANLQGVQIDPASIRKSIDTNLMFEKNGETLMINFMPSGTMGDKKIRFVVARGAVNTASVSALSEQDMIPQIMTKPKKDIAPVYPGAALMMLTEGPVITQATYMTKDNIEKVADFYRTSMPSAGWSLTGGTPIEKMDYGDRSADDISKLCPSCPKEAMAGAGSVEIWNTELEFGNKHNDTCRVLVSQSTNSQISSLTGATTIVVYYEENK
jgi:hypothetical protein